MTNPYHADRSYPVMPPLTKLLKVPHPKGLEHVSQTTEMLSPEMVLAVICVTKLTHPDGRRLPPILDQPIVRIGGFGNATTFRGTRQNLRRAALSFLGRRRIHCVTDVFSGQCRAAAPQYPRRIAPMAGRSRRRKAKASDLRIFNERLIGLALDRLTA